MDVSGISSASSNMSAAGLQYMASVKVMDMAQDVYKDAADELINEMNTIITGLGQNIDLSV